MLFYHDIVPHWTSQSDKTSSILLVKRVNYSGKIVVDENMKGQLSESTVLGQIRGREAKLRIEM